MKEAFVKAKYSRKQKYHDNKIFLCLKIKIWVYKDADFVFALVKFDSNRGLAIGVLHTYSWTTFAPLPDLKLDVEDSRLYQVTKML